MLELSVDPGETPEERKRNGGSMGEGENGHVCYGRHRKAPGHIVYKGSIKGYPPSKTCHPLREASPAAADQGSNWVLDWASWTAAGLET